MRYCTELADRQQQVIENLPDDKDRKRKHSKDLRRIEKDKK